jgi:hypothetical protein
MGEKGENGRACFRFLGRHYHLLQHRLVPQMDAIERANGHECGSAFSDFRKLFDTGY